MLEAGKKYRVVFDSNGELEVGQVVICVDDDEERAQFCVKEEDYNGSDNSDDYKDLYPMYRSEVEEIYQ